MIDSQEILRLINESSSDKTSVGDLEVIDKRINELIAPETLQLEQDITQKESQSELYLSGLSSLALNTSYSDIFKILERVSSEKSDATICDLGAGHCRMSLIAKLFFPDLKVISVEPIEKRVKHAQVFLEQTHHEFYTEYFENVFDKIIADYYFLYFPTGNIFESILDKLKQYQHEFSLIVIESHGEMINRLFIESSWLSNTPFLKLTYPRHNNNCFLFSKYLPSRETIESLYKKILKYEHVLIDNLWYADTDELELHFDNHEYITFEFSTPPRTVPIRIHNINDLKFIHTDDLDKDIQKMLAKRKNNEKINNQFIRKIYINGKDIELSDGSLLSY